MYKEKILKLRANINGIEIKYIDSNTRFKYSIYFEYKIQSKLFAG